MHEAHLMADLMRQINDMAKAERAKRITGVSVWLGALSHMSREHFAEHFQWASRGTLAEGARVEVVVSDDLRDAQAQGIILRAVEVET